ncbi:uncharacterized protein G2W53_039185 [Senna tora]|uniref:Uncharacterized protein n=1 Tax=Senna tora TaxID=362788 RepID=A0A834SN72_9FABA|nr:uncharacterized protein G2W53_039185 [Senna tora]
MKIKYNDQVIPVIKFGGDGDSDNNDNNISGVVGAYVVGERIHSRTR